MNNNLLVPTLLLLSLFATSFAHLDGAREESCYDQSIIHTVDLGGGEVINDPSTVCSTPCGYQLYVVGELAENGTLIEYETNTTTSFEYKLNTTYQFSLRIIMLAGGQQTNGFVGFLVQARESTDTFVPESSIHGTWEDNRMLYRPLNCGKSMANTSVLYPNSATQRLSPDIADIGGNNEVLLYWVSPTERADAATVVFWYTIVQQHRAHFFPVRGPVGNPPPTNPTTDPTGNNTVCEAEQDFVWWLFFPVTLAGFSYSRQCPQNGTGRTLGTATRFCTLDGVWEAVNIDNCTREVFILLNDRANELFLRNPSQNEVDDLLNTLGEATNVNATAGSTLFPQDLSTTNTIVKSSVNYLLQNVEIASPVSSLNFSEEVMNVLNNVLDERNTEGWERLQEDSDSQQLLLSAESYGQYVSMALKSEAVDTGNMTEITLVRQNIALAAMEVDPTSLGDIIFPEVVKVSEESGSAQTVIPAALLAERGALDENVTAVNILFSNLEDFLPKVNLEMNTTRPVSQVISSQVFSKVKLTNSQAQATFKFTTQKFSEDEVAKNARCVFWSVSSDAANSMWSTEGVTTVSVDEDEQMRVYDIVCESSHFTAFAVLMDVTGALNDTTPEIRFALSVVTYVGCSISIFFLLLSILYFLTLRKELLTKVHNFIHLNLSISLLLGYVVFLSGVDTAVANEVACVFVAALLHYLFTTVFFWMLCEGIMLYLMLVVVFSQISKKWWIFFIIGWVVPVIPVAISVGIIHDQYGTKEYCWIAVGAGDKGAIWAFVVPMLLVVLVNIFFLLAALRSVYKQKRSTIQRSGKKGSLQLFSQLFKATIILLPLLGLTWVFGLLSVNSSTIVFAWLFSIFNSLQGLFVFIFHVLRSEKVTKFLKQCRKRIDSVVSTSASGKNNLSKNPTSGVQLKPSHDSSFSKHDHSTMQDEAIKVDEAEFDSEKAYIAGLHENDEKWHTTIAFHKKTFTLTGKS